MKTLLVEKHRPTNIDDYLFQDEEVERKARKWISSKDIPNILLSGSAGTGKSTLSRIIVNELDIDPSDILYINASIESGIDVVRERIEPWVKRSSLNGLKVVQLEEADRLSSHFQLALRSLIEDSHHNVRWILTCNYATQIIEPIHSRLQHLVLSSMNEEGLVDHIADIIDDEGLSFNDEDDVMSHIEAYAPDMRKIINSIDEHTDENKIIHPLTTTSSGSDVDAWEDLWKSNGNLDFDEAMKIAAMIDQSNYEWFYQVMYQNHHKLPSTAEGIVLISKYLDRCQVSASQPLHLHACLYEIFKL